MKSKTLILSLFVLLAAVQLYIPAEMIFAYEDVLSTGKEFKFKTRPIDPNDPFRDKYIRLDMEESSFLIDSTREWNHQNSVFVLIKEDSLGFAMIVDVTENEPTSGDYLKAPAYRSFISDEGRVIYIDYPFERYYMEESKAYAAELVYRESNSDTTQLTYALVTIKDGQAVLKDVMINGESIRDVVLRQRAVEP